MRSSGSLSLLLLLTACTSGGGESPTTPAALPPLAGIWTVTSYIMPGIGAMTDSAAASWAGRSLRFTAEAAVAGDARCEHPAYATRTEPGDSLRTTFRVTPGLLPTLDRATEFTVLEVRCNGEPWAALGGTLIGVGDDQVLAPWDGVFFALGRDRDLAASGHDPEWQLAITRGETLRMQVDSGSREVIAPVPPEGSLPGGAGRLFHAISEAHDLTVMITPERCVDALRGDTLPATVVAQLDGQRYRGCGGPVP